MSLKCDSHSHPHRHLLLDGKDSKKIANANLLIHFSQWLCTLAYDIAKSRRASLSEVFLSVDSLRWPIIRAHCTP